MTNHIEPTELTIHDLAIDVPVLCGPQRQGDVLIVPAALTASIPVGASGTPVVRGENVGNTLVIYAAAGGPVYCDLVAPCGDYLRVATLTVPEGSTAYLGHPEHGYLGIASGSYQIRRQREQIGSTRIIAD